MSALTRVQVCSTIEVEVDTYFTCPLEIAEMYYKTLKKDSRRYVAIKEVEVVVDCLREYGIEEPGNYMIWDEEDGTKKCYKLQNYNIEKDLGVKDTVHDIFFKSK